MGDDAGLERGAAAGMARDTSVHVHLARDELASQALRGGVGSDHADQDRNRAERPHVLRHVGGPSQPQLLAVDVHDQNRRFRRDASRAPPEIAIQDHVADHEDAPAAEAIDTPRQRAAGEVRRGL